jgi:copper chaperone CopZ
MNKCSYVKILKYVSGDFKMKKTYKIDVDCANCANKMEMAAKKTEGVKDAVVNFMALKMKVEFEEGADPAEVMPRVLENCKIVEDDCEIFF